MASTFKNYITNNIGLANTVVYTANSTVTATIIGLTLSNLTASDIKVSLFLTSGANTAYVVKDAFIPTGSALVPVGGDQKLVLESTDSISVFSNTASSVDAITSVLELS